MVSSIIEAAGGVVLRRGDRAVEVLVVHRPKYDDWSLPKGKLEPREEFVAAALREVEEETGVTCRAVSELSSVRYRDHEDRPKLVRWWLMEPEAGDPQERAPDGEIGGARWLPVERLPEILTYEHDRLLVQEALRLQRPVAAERARESGSD